MIQHFRQAKMSFRNDLFHKSLHFSKSFKVFHCSVIKVLCFVVNRDNFLSISASHLFVNNLFNFFKINFQKKLTQKDGFEPSRRLPDLYP